MNTDSVMKNSNNVLLRVHTSIFGKLQFHSLTLKLRITEILNRRNTNTIKVCQSLLQGLHADYGIKAPLYLISRSEDQFEFLGKSAYRLLSTSYEFSNTLSESMTPKSTTDLISRSMDQIEIFVKIDV